MGLKNRYLDALKATNKGGNGFLTRDELKNCLSSRGVPASEIDVSGE